VLLAALCISGCGGMSHPAATTAKLGGYPPRNEQAFLGSCVREATASAPQTTATRYCRATLACIEHRLSLAEFVQVNRNAILGRANPNVRTITGCAQAGRRAIGK
jgi:hypothetical protein